MVIHTGGCHCGVVRFDLQNEEKHTHNCPKKPIPNPPRERVLNRLPIRVQDSTSLFLQIDLSLKGKVKDAVRCPPTVLKFLFTVNGGIGHIGAVIERKKEKKVAQMRAKMIDRFSVFANRVCGIHSFYIPRSNPDGFAVTIHCIDPGTVKSVTVNEFDGENWEHSFAGSTISKLSKD